MSDDQTDAAHSSEAPLTRDEQFPRPPRSTYARVIDTLEQTKEATGSRRAVIDGVLLGTCFLFINSMLSLPQLDTALSIALKAFMIAIPFLVWGLVWATYEFATPPVVVGVPAMVRAMAKAAAILEVPAQVAVFVGVCAVVWHIDSSAVLTLIAATVAILPLSMIVGGIVLVLYALGLHRKGLIPTKASSEPQSNSVQEHPL